MTEIRKPDQMSDGHTVRIRDHRWEKVKDHAWKLMNQNKEIVKPTDIVDACIWLYIDKITMEDIENAKKTQNPDD